MLQPDIGNDPQLAAKHWTQLYVCDDQGVCVLASPTGALKGRCLTELPRATWQQHGLPATIGTQLQEYLGRITETGEIVRLLIKDDADGATPDTFSCQMMPTTLTDDACGVAIELRRLTPARAEPESPVSSELLEAVPTPVVIARLSDWTCIYANRAAASLFGAPNGQLAGRSLAPHFQQPGDPVRLIESLASTGRLAEFSTQVIDGEGAYQHVTISGGAGHGRGARTALLFFSFTGTRGTADSPSERDALTGVCNRSALVDRMGKALRRAKRVNRRVAALFVDLNGFKEINDRHGHLVGDHLLAIIASRINGSVRDYDTVARLGGDEFVIVLEGLRTRREALRVKQAVQRAVSRPVRVAGVSVAVSASIGIGHYPEDADSVQGLLHTADQAMYREKTPVLSSRCTCQGNEQTA